jgi:hypothetical protein
MYIWEVVFEEHWDWMEEGEFLDGDKVDYSVAAGDYNSALEAAREVALKNSYYDEDEDAENFVTDVRLVSINRGKELDAIATVKAA